MSSEEIPPLKNKGISKVYFLRRFQSKCFPLPPKFFVLYQKEINQLLPDKTAVVKNQIII